MSDRDKAFGYAVSKWGTSNTPARENLAFADGWKAALDWTMTTTSPIANQAAGELCVLPKDVLDALRFYAHGDHYSIDDDHQSFDTVSGEPVNWMFSEKDDDCTMFEDGGIARAVLAGRSAGFEEPVEPFEGEVFAAMLSTAPTAVALEPDAVQHNGKDIMQIWFECNRDVFTFYDRITALTTGSAPEDRRYCICQEDAGNEGGTCVFKGDKMPCLPASPAASVLTDEELTALIRKVEDKLGIVWFVPDDSERYAWRTTNTNERLKYAHAILAASMGGEKS